MDAESTENAQALARVTPASSPSLITTPEEYNTILAGLDEDTNHVLSPMAQAMSGFLPGYALIKVELQIDPYIDPSSQRGQETYYNAAWMKGGKKNINDDAAERSLNLIGLRRVCNAAGIKWDSSATRRVDDGRRPYYWEFKAVGSYRTPVGEYLTVDGSTSLDLADGSAEIGYWTAAGWRSKVASIGAERAKEHFYGWSDARVLQQRIAGHRLAESKAKNAAIRDYGIPHVFTVKKLKETTFIIFRTVFLPDTTIPEIALMVARHALEGTTRLYPSAPLPRESRGDAEPMGRVIDAELADTDASDADETGIPAAIRVVDVRERTGNTNGRDWKLFIVSFSDGQSGSTLDAELAARARTFQKDRTTVSPALEAGQREGRLTLTGLEPVRAESAAPSAAQTATPAAEAKPATASSEARTFAPATSVAAPLTVVRVEPVGVNAANNCEVFDVVLSDGRRGRTDDHDRVMTAGQLGAAKTPVLVKLRPSPRVEGVLILDDIVPDEPEAPAANGGFLL